MAGEETTNQGNIKIEYNVATTGMNMDNTVNQVPKGMLTYALNAAVAEVIPAFANADTVTLASTAVPQSPVTLA
jgi:hypothetical protein